MTKLGQKLAFLVILGQALPATRCPVGGLVGGCGARAVSRKTPIYFIISNPKKHFCFGCFPGDMAMWLYGLWSKNGIEWSGWIPLIRCTVTCNMCGANSDLLLSF